MKKLIGTLIFIFFIYRSDAQEKEAPPPIELQEQSDHAYDWVPTMLNATKSSLYNMITYQGKTFGWQLRGDNISIEIFDAIEYPSILNKWRLGDIFSGLQGQFQKKGTSINGSFTDQGHVESENVNYFSSSILEESKRINIGTAVSNSFFGSSLNFKMYKPNLWHHWKNTFSIALQTKDNSSFAGRYKKSVGIIYGIEKQLSKKNNLGLNVIWNYSDQSKMATAVKEAFELSQQNTYNPTWGRLKLKEYYPNSKQSNAPVIAFTFQHYFNEYHYYKFNNSIIVGRQSTSSLEWTQTADPRPDYYRYLPSYQNDSSLRSSLSDWYLAHPEKLQINFDKIEQINKSSSDHRSYYIVNQQNSDLFLFNGNFIYAKYLRNDLNMSGGAQYLFNRIVYSNQVKDLLGGNYYYNYNNWINDEGVDNNFQNDLNQPDRKIKQFELWGPRYSMTAFKIYPWLQLNKNYARFETVFEMGYGVQALSRYGYNKNGLFPQSSFGKSGPIWSTGRNFKGQILYKFSGRLYLRSIFFAKWKLPSVDQVYIDPSFSSITQSNQNKEFRKGADLSIFYRTPNINIALSAYLINIYNNAITNMFYHDQYTSFVYGLVEGINKTNIGIEFSIVIPLISKFQVTVVSTLQKNTFTNNPQYKLLSVNDLKPIASGIIYLQNIASSSSPSFANGLNIMYQPINTLSIGLGFVYVKQRPISIDYFRRSEAVKNKLDRLSWEQIQQTNYLNDNSIVTIYTSKSTQIKLRDKAIKLLTTFGIKNLLNSFIPVFAYEQSRFDYIKFNTNKYANKLLLDQGVTYSLRFQLQIQ